MQNLPANITKIICLLDMGTMALGLIFVLVVSVSCILSVCVCLLCGGRIKIVDVTEMGRDGDSMVGYGDDFCPGVVAL